MFTPLIANPSFEDDALTDPRFTIGTVTGWTLSGKSGAFAPTVGDIPDGPCDGTNIIYIETGTVTQDVALGTTLKPGDVLTLTFGKAERSSFEGTCKVTFADTADTEIASSILAEETAGSCYPGKVLTHTVVSGDDADGETNIRLVLSKPSGVHCYLDDLSLSVLSV